MSWISYLEFCSIGVFVISIVVGFLVSAIDASFLGYSVGLGIFISLIIKAIDYYTFYKCVKCPECGGRLNKFKNGKNVPQKQAYTQLQNGYGCRHCGWKPNYANQIA